MIYIFLIFCIFLIFILFLLNFFFYPKKYIIVKNNIYECGFENFSSFNEKIDLKFFIIGILFIIFDIEIIFLLPLSINFFFLGYYGFFIMLYFIFILTIGFIYE